MADSQQTVTVHNLDTTETYVYVGLSYPEAVRNAHAQYERRDFNTWSYEERYPVSGVIVRERGSKRIYILGSMGAVEEIAG